MDGATLQDRFSRGMGSAAVRLGMPHDLYRGRGCVEPLAAENRALRLSAAFDGGDPGYRRPHGYERALRGIFDVVCTQVGDYLRGPRGVLFIAMLPPLQRPLCVLTNGVLDVLRPVGPQSPGLNGYGGVQEPRLQAVLSGWPGQVLGGGGGGGRGELPNDGAQPGWSVLLPHTPEPILGSDLLRDEAGRRFVVRTAELSELGWRLMVRQAGV
jgi:hypothetical protein